MNKAEFIHRIIESRKTLIEDLPSPDRFETEAEGGCGVTGFACNIPVRGKHIFEPSADAQPGNAAEAASRHGLRSQNAQCLSEMLEEDYILQSPSSKTG
jgi:hypothetical protein